MYQLLGNVSQIKLIYLEILVVVQNIRNVKGFVRW